MKFLTTNFVRCPIKTCATTTKSFPLKFQETQLVQEEEEFNEQFMESMLERLDWDAVVKVALDLGNTSIPLVKPELVEELLLRDLHHLLMETKIIEGKMVCGNCEHVFYVKDGIPNFLLPPHLV